MGETQSSGSANNRSRPFMVTNDETCVPSQEKVLRASPSYPSGHASLGYVWGEVLAEVAPQQAAALRARAWQFMESRAVCRVHWQSDVDAGRSVGAAVLPVLHRDAEFLADLAAARTEVKRVRKPGPAAGRDCSAEAEAFMATPVR
jgi:acid phosphatase (class A)